MPGKAFFCELMVPIPQKILIILEMEEENCLIFDNTIQEKAWTDENEVMSWYCGQMYPG